MKRHLWKWYHHRQATAEGNITKTLAFLFVVAVSALWLTACNHVTAPNPFSQLSNPVLRNLSTATPNKEGFYGCYNNGDGTWDCSSNCTNSGIVMTCTDVTYVFIISDPTGPGLGTTILDPGMFGGGASGYKGPGVLNNTQKRWSKALLYKGTSTFKGPDGGANACVWILQQMQAAASLNPLANGTTNVDKLHDWLAAGNGTPVTQDKAVAGDLVIQGSGDAKNGQNHVGICENNGCTQILSNESTYSYFDWVATPAEFANDFKPVLPNGYWHVTAPNTFLNLHDKQLLAHVRAYVKYGKIDHV